MVYIEVMRRRVLPCVVIGLMGFGAVVACGAFSGSDAKTLDEGGTADGAADGTADGAANDGGAKTAFCAATDATFCDDFDEHALGIGWNGIQTTDGSFLALDDATATSPGRSLVADNTGGLTVTPFNIAQLSKGVGAPPTKLQCEFDVRATVGMSHGLLWTLNGSGKSGDGSFTTFNVYLFYEGMAPYVASAWASMGVQGNVETNLPLYDVSAWSRLRIDITLDPNACFGEMRVSTMTGDVATPLGNVAPIHTGPDAGCIAPTEAQLLLGLSNAPGWRVHYDNVACTWSK